MKGEVIDKLAALITAAFGLIAALAWNTTIQSIFANYIPGNGMIAMLSYAVVVTVIAVIVTIWIGRISERAKARLVKKK